MAGIAPQPQPSAPPAQQAQPQDQSQQQGPSEVGDEEGLSPNVSPQEQNDYEEFVLAGMAIIYQKGSGSDQEPDDKQDQAQGIAPQQEGTPQDGGAKVRPGILQLLDNDPSDLKAILKIPQLDQDFSPVVAIAATAALVTLEVVKLGGSPPPADDIIFHGGAAILQDLCQVWMTRNKKQLGEDDVHRALSVAADIYREVAADQGMIDEDSLKQQFAQLVQADKSGNLASISPDLAGINQAAAINQQQGEDVPSPDQQPDQPQPQGAQ